MNSAEQALTTDSRTLRHSTQSRYLVYDIGSKQVPPKIYSKVYESMHNGRITSETELIREVSESDTGVEGGMTTVNTDVYTLEVVPQLDEECLQYTHLGISEVVRPTAVGKRDVNEVIDELKVGTVCEDRN